MAVDAVAGAQARVLETIDAQRDELIRFLAEYVSIPSVNPGRAAPGEVGDEAPCQRWLADRLRSFGVFAAVDLWEEVEGRPNLAATLGSSGEAALMFNGHTDTVEVTEDQREAWAGDPWSGEVRGERLYGRGSTDMKAGNAAFCWAAKVVGEIGIPLDRDVHVTASIAEETAEADVGPLSVVRRGYTAPIIVNAEPTGLRICPAGMGWFFFRVSVKGKRLHPASRYTAVWPQPHGVPIEGVDAIEKTRKVMAALSELERDWSIHQRHPLVPPGDMGLCPVYIHGGAHRAAMSDACEVEYAVVYNPGLRSGDVLAQIEAAVDGVAATDTWLREHPPQLEAPVIHQILEPVDVPLDHAAVTGLTDAFRTALGREPERGSLPGPCDANIMCEEGLPTVIFGPGDLSFGAHGTNEYVPVDQVVEACKVYATLILDRCSRRETP
jgi:acetylornithine deacetylase/succinyl-diaminopimelate desuccinylase family protein